jgi:hypothetical protein
MDQSFRGRRSDIRKGLRCKLLIAQGLFDEAKLIWRDLNRKDLPVHGAMYRQILLGLEAAGSISSAERAELQRLSAISPDSVDEESDLDLNMYL